MFEHVQVYSGKIASEINMETDEALQTAMGSENTQFFHENANSQAIQLLENAQLEVEEILSVAREKATTEADAIIAEKLNTAALEHATSLWSSKMVLAHIVEAALINVVGNIGKGVACLGAVETAVSKHLEAKTLNIRVSSDSIDRLKLAVIANRANKQLPSILEIKEDSSLEDGRCILETENSCFEIGVDAQITAFANASRIALKNNANIASSSDGAF